MEMNYSYRPYFDPEYDSLLERIHPPRVCIDNDSCRDCTLVKVDSANKHGILLEMVQVLTDLDLVISKSYICSDGGWFMDVFHVTDQLGNKITDEGLIHYIQQAICASRKGKMEMQTSIDLDIRPRHVSTDRTALEMTGTDRPGMMSEISATLAELGCNVSAAVAWTYNSRVACILYMEDGFSSMPITDPCRLARIQTQLETVVEAHHCNGERRSVKLAVPTSNRTHTERRLHQLMTDDRDYDESLSCATNGEEYQPQRSYGRCRNGNEGTEVTIENCEEKGYSIVTLRTKDRPKLLFDTVCVLTDMQYVVFHAAMRSQGSMAIQEYYIRQKDGHTLNTGNERLILAKCLTAAVERRVSHGLRLDVSTHNRLGLLSDVTRVFRENGLTIVRAELGTRGPRAIGSFYVTDTSGYYVNSDTMEAVRKEIGGSILAVDGSATTTPETSTRMDTSRSTINDRSRSDDVEERSRISIGCLLWSQLERLSHNFKPIKS